MKFFYIENIRLPTEKAHGYQIMKTCEALTKCGVDVELVATDRKTTGGDPMAFYGIDAPFTIRRLHVVDWISIWPRVLWTAAFMIERWTFERSLAKYVRTFSDDVVCYTRDARIALLLKKIRPRISVFVELHALPKPRLLKRLAKIDGVVALTSWLRKEAAASSPKLRTVVIPDAVDLDVFDPRSSRQEARTILDVPLEAKVVVYGGRFTTMEQGKGLGMLDRAVARLATVDPSVRLLLVGGTVEQFIAIEKRSPSSSTTCVPSVDRQTLALYYRAADVLAMPFPDTPHYANEMSPLKMFEYMASSTPIISSDLPAVRDVLDESSAVFYPADSFEGLVAALGGVLHRDVSARELVARRARKIVEEHTWEQRAQDIRSFITAV